MTYDSSLEELVRGPKPALFSSAPSTSLPLQIP